jgi:hypothetical protein
MVPGAKGRATLNVTFKPRSLSRPGHLCPSGGANSQTKFLDSISRIVPFVEFVPDVFSLQAGESGASGLSPKPAGEIVLIVEPGGGCRFADGPLLAQRGLGALESIPVAPLAEGQTGGPAQVAAEGFGVLSGPGRQCPEILLVRFRCRCSLPLAVVLAPPGSTRRAGPSALARKPAWAILASRARSRRLKPPSASSPARSFWPFVTGFPSSTPERGTSSSRRTSPLGIWTHLQTRPSATCAGDVAGTCETPRPLGPAADRLPVRSG